MEIREPAVTTQTGGATVPRPLTTGRAGTAEQTGGASTKKVPDNRQGGSDVVDLSGVGQKKSRPVESRQVPTGSTGSADKQTAASQKSSAVQKDSPQVGFNSDNNAPSARRSYALDQGDLVVKIVTNGEVVREIPTEDQRKIKQAIKKYVSQSSSSHEQADGTNPANPDSVKSSTTTPGNNTVDTGAVKSSQVAGTGAAKTDSDGDNDPNAEAGEGKEQNKVADIVS